MEGDKSGFGGKTGTPLNHPCFFLAICRNYFLLSVAIYFSMGAVSRIFTAVAVAGVAYVLTVTNFISLILGTGSLPEALPSYWEPKSWATGVDGGFVETVSPFTVAIGDEELQDLRVALILAQVVSLCLIHCSHSLLVCVFDCPSVELKITEDGMNLHQWPMTTGSVGAMAFSSRTLLRLRSIGSTTTTGGSMKKN